MTGSSDREMIEQIKELKARYFRFMDCKQWHELESLFMPDVVIDMRHGGASYDEAMLYDGGARRYIETVAPILQDMITVHHGHMPEITLTSPTSAAGIWAMEDKLWAPEGHPIGWRHLHGYGHYHETYERSDDRWRIRTIRLSRLHIEVC